MISIYTKGFSTILLILFFAVLASAVGYFTLSQRSHPSIQQTNIATSTQSQNTNPVLQTVKKPTPTRPLAQCLPLNIKINTIVDYGINLTVQQKLAALHAVCRENTTLVDGSGREIYFYSPTTCWGNAPQNYQALVQQEQDRIDLLKQTYDVIVFGCNPEIE